MEIKTSKEIVLSAEDVENLIIKGLYHSQGLSGIFNIKFKVAREFSEKEGDYNFVFDGAEVKISENIQS